jgi:hypothetical protein
MASSSAGFNGGGLSDLGNRTLLQLRELASRLGLGGYSRMSKAGLVEAAFYLPKTLPSSFGICLPRNAASACSISSD